MKEHPKQRDGVDGSEDLYRRPYKQERVSENFFRMPERIHSSTRKGFASKPSHESVNNERNSLEHSDSEILLNDEIRRVSSRAVNGLSEEQKEHLPNSRKSPREAQENRFKADIIQNRNHETVPREEEGEKVRNTKSSCFVSRSYVMDGNMRSVPLVLYHCKIYMPRL